MVTACAQEARIVSGLKRPAIGKPAARTGGSPDGAGGWALRAAALSGGAVARTRPVMGRIGAWAADRQISPGTLHGISLLLALCAAIWLSGGEADRGAGLLALVASVLAMAGGGRLAAYLGTNAARPRSAARRRARADESTDWLALPDVPWGDEQPGGAVQGGAGDGKPGHTGATQGTGSRSADDDADVIVVSRDEVTPGATAGPMATGSAEAIGGAATTAARVATGKARASAVGATVSVRSYGWIAAVSAAAAESAIYGGLAAGGGPARPLGMWPLAVLTIAAVGTADLLGASRAAAAAAAGAASPAEAPNWIWPRRLPGLPRGARLVLAGLALLLAGPQAGLFAVLGAELIALAWMVVALGRISPPADAVSRGGAARARRQRAGGTRGGAAAVLGAMSPATAPGADASEGGTRTRVTALVGVDGPAGTTAVRIITSARATRTAKGQAADADAGGPAVGDVSRDATGCAEPAGGEPREPTPVSGPAESAGRADAGPVWVAGLAGEPDEPIAVGGVAGSAGAMQAEPETADTVWAADTAGVRSVGGSRAGSGDRQYPAAANPRRVPGGVLALRDDGAAAQWAGRLVQGNLIPLPPALAGLVATAMLAALGLRGLHGLVAMTPPIVMMLAAPGSSHPHDGRFDWLVPGLLLLAQYVYLGALGFAVGVPHPIIFAACALTGLWYVSLAARAADGRAADGRAVDATNIDTTDAGSTKADGAAEIAGLARARGGWAGAGWEVRLFLTGLAVTFGLGAFGYVGLAAYLGVLLVRQAANRHRYLTHVEDDRQ